VGARAGYWKRSAFPDNEMNATFEAGLPGTGPLPVHLHTGRPTPWSEGCVVRSSPDSAPSWIGNLQPGYGYAMKIILWDDANAFIVIAKGASYFVRPDNPDNWRFLDLLGIDCVLSPSRDVALLATYTDVIAISTKGVELWRRTVAVDGVTSLHIESELIYGRAAVDSPDDWRSFVLRLDDGTDGKQGAAPEPPMRRA
jgi:hypothetical protein